VAAVTRVSVERIVRVPFSVAHEYAEIFFKDTDHDIAVHVPLRDFFRLLNGQVSKPVRMQTFLHPDDEEDGRIHDALMVEWTAGISLFPDFHGTLRFRIASVDATRLILDGAYRPPAGVAGQAFDAVAGKRIATSTLKDLLERLAVAMEQREERFRTETRAAAEANA
jgi:hypothetical protein